MKKGTRFLITSLALAYGSLLIWNLRERSSERINERTQSADEAVRSPPGAMSPANLSGSQGFLFHPTEKRRYLYTFERKIALHGLPSSNGVDPVISYHGELRLDVFHADSSGFEALASGRLAEHPVANPVVLRLRVNSRGDEIAMTGGVIRTDEERQQEAFLKDLIANWAFPLRSDTVGSYSAQFEPMPSENGFSRMKKIKLTYSQATLQKPEIASSLHLLKWDDSLGLPYEIVGEESTRLGQGSVALSSESSYAIRFFKILPTSFVSESELARLSLPVSLDLNHSDRAGRADHSQLSWAQVSDELRHLMSQDSAGRLKTFGDLVALLRSRGEVIPDILSLLQSENVLRLGAQSALFKAAVGALATVGSSEAQAAVLKLYQDPDCPVSGKGTILAALTTTQAGLTPTTRDFLASAVEGESNSDLSQGAAFALGASLRSAPDDSAREHAVELIKDEWETQGSATVGERLALLDVMGNSGSVEFLPALREAINSGDALVEAKAVFALRFVQSNDATLLLAQHLSDTDARVRQAAVDAIKLSSWNETFRKPLQTCSASDTAKQTQATCQTILQSAPAPHT